MAELHLVTGYKGTPHVTSADQGLFNALTIAGGDYVLNRGRKFEAQIISNNIVRIFDGSLLMNGRYINLDSGLYLDASISNGSSGMNRHDIIAIRYEADLTTGIESASLVVISGTPSAGTATDPTITNTGNILDGATVHDMPLYRVTLTGMTLTKVEPLFNVLAPMADFQHGFYKQNLIINGDFQCNQRGSKEYTTSGTVRYTLDMWRAHNVTVKQRNDGVQLTGVGATTQFFTQFIQLGLLRWVPYTISTMVDDEICTFTLYTSDSVQEKDFGKFKISVLGISEPDTSLPDFNNYNNKIKVSICPIGTNTIVVKYVDVFEGAIAYPHVKEDYATALMRCRRYIYKGTYFSPILDWFRQYDDEPPRMVFGIPIDGMVGAPVLESIQWLCKTGSHTISGDQPKKMYEHLRTDYELQWAMFNDYLDMDADGANVLGVRIRYTLSCEHNPNGD